VQAHQHIAKALILNPNNVQAIINLCVCYYNTQQINKIKPLLKEALGVDSSNIQVKEMMKSL
jgi:cytochrome c-type biogenesis protein CcmH/NrfG